MTAVAERHEALAAAFDAFRRDPAFGTGAAGQDREAAFRRFVDAGFPTTRDEEWRFTNVAPIAALSFARADRVSLDRAAIDPFLLPDAGVRVVVVNGRVATELSALDALPAGVRIETRAADLPAADAAASPFVDLNRAFFEQAVVVTVAPKAVVTTPIQILSVTVAGDQPVLVLPRVHINVGEAAQVSIIESYAGLGEGPALTSAVTDVQVAKGAVVEHVKFQQETLAAFHMATLQTHVDRAGTFTSRALTFGGRIARNGISAVLAGEGAECTLDGLYIATDDSLVDTHTTIDHAMPHCPSHEVYKGILGGRAKAVFNGKIVVRQDAQKTNAKQTNKALLLTDDAQINTKPQLEIFADDVKCTHGAAIGQLDEDAMFYLRARGIEAVQARNMLIHAFAGEVLDGIGIPGVRERAMHLMEEKLHLPA